MVRDHSQFSLTVTGVGNLLDIVRSVFKLTIGLTILVSSFNNGLKLVEKTLENCYQPQRKVYYVLKSKSTQTNTFP